MIGKKEGGSRVLATPFTASKARELRAGDIVYLSGTIVTSRDAAHEFLLDATKPMPAFLTNALSNKVIYHTGPVAQKTPSGWEIKASGPTTSARMNAVEQMVMKKYDIHAIIGKGGMSNVDWKKLEACYLAFVGGAALIAKNAIKRVLDVAWLELGIAEAAWIFQVENFGPLVVAQDAHGNDLYADVLKKARSAK